MLFTLNILFIISSRICRGHYSGNPTDTYRYQGLVYYALLSDTRNPTPAPTISARPSISAAPSLSLVPTSSPTKYQHELKTPKSYVDSAVSPSLSACRDVGFLFHAFLALTICFNAFTFHTGTPFLLSVVICSTLR